ncbi:MAG: hypothetical protein RPU63_11910 [Candidatus Sedimenticola sp. (ex Thyasira tokunagai)]
MFCEILTQYLPLDNQDIREFAFLSIVLQFIGFIILVRDMWPLYKKEKSIQYVYWLLNFTKCAKGKFDSGNEFGVTAMFAHSTDAFRVALKDIKKYESSLDEINREVFLDKEKLSEFYDTLAVKHESIIEKIKTTQTLRGWYVGEAVFLIILGYIIQLVLNIPCAP